MKRLIDSTIDMDHFCTHFIEREKSKSDSGPFEKLQVPIKNDRFLLSVSVNTLITEYTYLHTCKDYYARLQ